MAKTLAVVSLLGLRAAACARHSADIRSSGTPIAVVITRIDHTPGRAQPPLQWTFRAQPEVRDLYGALEALPPFPSGTISCPAQFFVSYRLVFSTRSETLLTADVSPSGCAKAILEPGGDREGRSVLATLRKMLGMSSGRFTGASETSSS